MHEEILDGWCSRLEPTITVILLVPVQRFGRQRRKLSLAMEALIVGWFEPISLPSLGIELCYGRIDSGADFSTLHARDVVVVGAGSEVEFTPPLLRRQSSSDHFPAGGVRRVRAPCVDERIIRNSGGSEELRYVILAEVHLGARVVETELTLTHREGMRFPLLVGRQTLVDLGPVLIDPAHDCLTEPEFERAREDRA